MSRKTNVSTDVPFEPPTRKVCPEITTALEYVKLANGEQENSTNIEQLSESVTKLSNHALSYCKCISPSTAFFAAASCQFHIFIKTTETNVSQVIEEEIVSCQSLSDRSEDKSESDQFVGIAPKRGSVFDGTALPHLVNRTRQNDLLKPLDKMLTYLDSAIGPKAKFSREDVKKFRVQDNLRTAFYVYQLYRVVENQYRCATLVKKLSTGSTDHLRSAYFKMSIALQIGDIEMAVWFREEGKKYDVVKNTDSSVTIDSTLFYYLSIETDLRKGIDQGESLQTFLNSSYIQKSSVNRVFLKAVGLLLASKFPGNFGYRHDKYSKEMIDPHRISLFLVKRWNKKLIDLKSESRIKSDESLDPSWLRYATYNLFFESYVTVSSFYCYNGNPSEISCFHEAVIRFSREHCILYWLRKVLIIASDMDILMDKHGYAHHKLTNSLDLIDHESMITSAVHRSKGSQRKNSDEDELTWKLSTVKLESYSNDDDKCLHEKNIAPWDVKKAVMKTTSDHSPEELFQARDYLSLEPIECDIFGADVDRIEAIMKLIMLKNKTPYERVSKLTRIAFGSNLKNSYKRILSIRKQYQRKMTMEEAKSFSHDAMIFLSLKLRTMRSSLIIESGLTSTSDLSKNLQASQSIFEKEYNQRMDLVDGYMSRMVFAQFCLLHAIASNKIVNAMNNCSPLTLYEEIARTSIVKGPERSPSPVRNTRSQRKPPPRAPKGKNPYKMEEFQDYFKNLNHQPLRENSRNCGDFTLAQRYKMILDEISLKDASFEYEKEKKTPKKVSKSVSEYQKVAREPTKSLRDDDSPPQSSRSVTNQLFKAFCELKSDPSAILFSLDELSKYVGIHPPAEFHRQTNLLMAKLFLDASVHNVKLSSYHFSEVASTSFRFRFMKMVARRMKTGKSIKHPIEDLEFNTELDSDYVQKVLERCPDGWRILQLEMTEAKIDARSGKVISLPDLIVSRYEKRRNPLFLTIKSDDKYLKNFMSEMKEIIELSNTSAHERDPTSFWKVRNALDNRLGRLLKSVEHAWFGPFKGLFIGSVRNTDFNDITRKIRKTISKISESQKITIDQELLRVLIESIPLSTENDFKAGIASIFDSFDTELLDQVWNLSAVAMTEYSNVYSNSPISPIGLILGRGLEMFPWESVPIARTMNQEFFRIPSIRFLSASLTAFESSSRNINEGLNPRNTFYLVNPTANLPKTEERFKSKMIKQDGWTGVIGRYPRAEELVEGLETKDIYVYFGHGAGSDFCKLIKDNLEGVDVQTASLVIGCSSGRLKGDGSSLEPFGPAYRYLSNGAPSYVGALWDVTDRDIDLFSDMMLEVLVPNWKSDSTVSKKAKKGKTGSSICRAVAEARHACKLKYLIGAATVVYGLPVGVSHLN